MKLAVSPIHKGRAITACDLCGTRFLSWISEDRRYCSQKCFNHARHLEAYVTRPCEACGLVFDAAKRKNQRFCGSACRAASRRTPVEVICAQCGATFISTPAVPARYCSRSCKNTAARGRVTGRRIDLTGERFGRLVVSAPAANHRSGRTQWLCTCDCGRTATVTAHDLRSGNTRSCGCLLVQHVAEKFGPLWGTPRHFTHRLSHTPEYAVWHDMRRRCNNPRVNSYRLYGARGIKVCERWDDFANFMADMGPRPGPDYQLERRDNDGPYAPENCLWIHRSLQARNTRRNRLIAFDGRTQTMFEWAREIGISPAGLCTRLNRDGLSVEEALTRPVRGRK